jgi:hypothetical protein
VKEGQIHINFSLMPYQQAAIITKSSEGSFNFPAVTVTPEFSSILQLGLFSVLSMWNNKINFELFEPFSKWIAIIAFVTNQAQRALFRAATAISWHFHRFKRFVRRG